MLCVCIYVQYKHLHLHTHTSCLDDCFFFRLVKIDASGCITISVYTNTYHASI